MEPISTMNETIRIASLMECSGVQFGTSGVRGRVREMTDKVCFAYVTAFLDYLRAKMVIQPGDSVGVAGDLRCSTPRIMNAAAAAIAAQGYSVINFGHIPSPALALTGIETGIATIMVTGSHIPDDRNGIKFNLPSGEILKQDEVGIRNRTVSIDAALFSWDSLLRSDMLPLEDPQAKQRYIKRFTQFFPENCLKGKHIGVYEHSSVARDCLTQILQHLGASVTSLGRSDAFIAVDTEAIRPEDIAAAQQWAAEGSFDCIVSTDGDGDRPLVSDEQGNWLRGDIAGLLCAMYLQADCVVTPVSSNSAVEKCGLFRRVVRTKIGSPYVIEAMRNLERETAMTVVAYEANGGFLQQSPLEKQKNTLAPLPTRDAVIVPLAILMLAQERGVGVAQLLASLPSRYTYSDRIKNFPTQSSQQLLAMLLAGSPEHRLATIATVFHDLPSPVALDTTDGVRMTLANEEVVHLRPSGNAPELRCYTEAATPQRARQLNHIVLSIVMQLQETE